MAPSSPLVYALQSMGLRSAPPAAPSTPAAPSSSPAASIVAASPTEKKKIELFSTVRDRKGQAPKKCVLLCRDACSPERLIISMSSDSPHRCDARALTLCPFPFPLARRSIMREYGRMEMGGACACDQPGGLETKLACL